jgi:hypothetical protein
MCFRVNFNKSIWLNGSVIPRNKVCQDIGQVSVLIISLFKEPASYKYIQSFHIASSLVHIRSDGKSENLHEKGMKIY